VLVFLMLIFLMLVLRLLIFLMLIFRLLVFLMLVLLMLIFLMLAGICGLVSVLGRRLVGGLLALVGLQVVVSRVELCICLVIVTILL